MSTLNLDRKTNVENYTVVKTKEEFLNMNSSLYYVLGNDIVLDGSDLELIKAVGRLDGGDYKLIIKGNKKEIYIQKLSTFRNVLIEFISEDENKTTDNKPIEDVVNTIIDDKNKIFEEGTNKLFDILKLENEKLKKELEVSNTALSVSEGTTDNAIQEFSLEIEQLKNTINAQKNHYSNEIEKSKEYIKLLEEQVKELSNKQTSEKLEESVVTVVEEVIEPAKPEDLLKKDDLAVNEVILEEVIDNINNIKGHTTKHRFNAGDKIWFADFNARVESNLYQKVEEVYKFRPVEVSVKEVVIRGKEVFYRFTHYNQTYSEEVVGATRKEVEQYCNLKNDR